MADLQPGPGVAVTWCDACSAWHEDTTPWRADPTPWVAGCTGKVRHPTSHAALAVAKREPHQGVALYPYPCRHCGGWHLSRTRAGRWQAERIAVEARLG